VLRIVAEHFREPDSAMIGVFTKGQFYSLFMVLAGVAFLATMRRESRQD
jgi:phosphatidylglycerol:prolipoprotein diacylglycerol transferase